MLDFPLIRELDDLFRKDPDIDELGIIFHVPPPVLTSGDPASKNNITPSEPAAADAADATGVAEPNFILHEHKLGVSVHSIHPLINEARAALPAASQEYRRLRQACLLHKQQRPHQHECREGHQGKAREGDETQALSSVAGAAETLLSVTRALLLVNADHGSAWNARKLLVADGLFEGSSIPQEIKLLNLIFTKHAKSPNAWAHRRWCWRKNDKVDSSIDNRERSRARHKGSTWQPLDVEQELKVCQRVAELYPKNYYAWTQRSWVVLRVVGSASARADVGAGGEDAPNNCRSMAAQLLQQEISFVDKWMTSHVSDHSALNHRKNVVSALAAVSAASDETARLSLLEKERSASSKLLRDYPGHESLWCHRRFVCQARLLIVPYHPPIGTSGGSPPAARGQNTPKPSESGDRCYDWEGWSRAVNKWYDRCVREDAKEAAAQDSEGESEDDNQCGGFQEDAGESKGVLEEVEGKLPGAPAGGCALAEFLGHEACFALKCATDKGAWQFDKQRQYALAHLAFVAYAAHRVVLGTSQQERREKLSNMSAQGQDVLPARAVGAAKRASSADLGDSSVEADERTAAGWLTYCEVTGAPKLTFPLASSPSVVFETSSAGVGGGGVDCAGNGVLEAEAALRALRALNAFVAGLAKADADDAVRKKSSCGFGRVAPYAIQEMQQ